MNWHIKYNYVLVLMVMLFQTAYSQDYDTLRYLNNITEKIFKLKPINELGNDVYVDLNRKSVTIAAKYPGEREETFTDFKYSIYEGSFLNKSYKEYLFVVYSGYYTSHADNGGLTTFMYIFDNNYNQISERFNQYAETEIIDIVDIDNNGYNEIIMKDSYGMMGFFKEWISIYEKKFDIKNNKLTVPVFFNSDFAGIGGREYINVDSEYFISNSSLIVESRLDYYICMGKMENYEADNRYIKSESRKDMFEYDNGLFKHIKDANNVNWDDPRLEF